MSILINNGTNAEAFSLSRASQSVAVRTVTVHDFASLSSHWALWDRLACNAPQRVPTLSPAWVEAHLRHRLRPEERWCCSFTYAGERLVGVLPVVITPHRILGAARPVLRTLFDDHTPSGDILLDANYAVLALRAMLSKLGEEIPAHLGIEVRRVRQNSPLLAALPKGLDDHRLLIGLCSKGSLIRLEGGRDEYMAGLGKKMRWNLKNSRKKLQEMGEVSVEIKRGADANEDFVQDFLSIEASGWKGRNGTAIANDPDTTAFYTALVRSFASQGRLEWHVLRVQGRVVAASMGIRCGASLMIPKIGFDENYAAGAPGRILTGELIENGFSRSDLVEINYMSDEPWQRYWRMHQDDYVDLYLARDGLLPYLLHGAFIQAKIALKRHVKPRLPNAMLRAVSNTKSCGLRLMRRLP